MSPRRRTATFLFLVAAAWTLAGGSAAASTPLGQTATSGTFFENCAGTYTEIQVSTGGAPSYTVPSGGGVITAWTHEGESGGGGSGNQLKLKIYRPTMTANQFTVVGQSQAEPLAAGTNSFTTRIPVQAGDLLGYTRTSTSDIRCLFSTASSSDIVQDAPGMDTATGGTTLFNPTSVGSQSLRINMAAVLEPDADSDGFGDETQDQCPTDASTQSPCPKGPAADTMPPGTAITRHPKGLVETDHQKVKVKFSFSSDEVGSTFECKLDRTPFKPCSSPKRYRIKATEKVKEHTFWVEAIDSAGNKDATPAKRSFKVERLA
jgi:hypothetical protein